MTQAERGLFETITSYMNLDIRHRNTMRLKEICAEFEQRLADANETIDVLRDLNDKTSDKLIANRFENLELSKRLAEAERDKARVDWLEKQFILAAYPPDVGESFHLWPGKGTVRAQIDVVLTAPLPEKKHE